MSAEKPYTQALFASLVYNEAGQPAEVAHLGQEAFYVILDDDFRRHVEARHVDQQVLSWLKEQITANQAIVTDAILGMLGKDDLFTKAMIDSSIKNVDDLNQINQAAIPPDALMMLGMMGFRVVVDVHGDVVEVTMPEQSLPDDFD